MSPSPLRPYARLSAIRPTGIEPRLDSHVPTLTNGWKNEKNGMWATEHVCLSDVPYVIYVLYQSTVGTTALQVRQSRFIVCQVH